MGRLLVIACFAFLVAVGVIVTVGCGIGIPTM